MGTHPIFESDFDCLTEKKEMNLFVGNQRILVFTQVTFILFDLCVNMFIDLFAKDPVLKLVTLVLQLIILLLSILLILLVLFNTYPVQTGQFRKIISKFQGLLCYICRLPHTDHYFKLIEARRYLAGSFRY